MLQKKILFISHEASFSGAPIYLSKFLRYLKSERPDYSLLVMFASSGAMVEQLERDGLTVTVILKRAAMKSSVGKFLQRIKYYVKYIKLLHKYRPNLIYSNTSVNCGEVLLSGLLGYRVLMHVHEGVNFISKYPYRLRFASKFCDEVIAGSNYVSGVLKRLVGRAGVVVYNGIDFEGSKYFSNRSYVAPLRLGILGTIDRNKGHMVALLAMEKLIGLGVQVRLQVAGAAVDRMYYEVLTDFLYGNSLHESVDFLGMVPDISSFYRSIDVLLVPSYDEAFPTVILEAIKYGVLVVASSAGGIPEMIQDGITGFLFPVGDSDALAAAIKNICHNPSKYSHLRIAASELLCERFSCINTNRSVLKILDGLL